MSSTKTQQPYFPHYANSRNEDSMIRLRMVHGVAGYGVYHMLLERLRMSENYQCELDYDVLCWDLNCCEQLIRSVIYDFGLFEIVCDGQKFQSMELNAYMKIMEEKKREKSEKAQAAANARWGKISPSKIPEETTDNGKLETVVCADHPEGGDTARLDKEIEAIEGDETWLKEMSEEAGKTTEEIQSCLPEFRKTCILRGLKNGHKDMNDSFAHFRSWLYRSGKAKDPNSSVNRNSENCTRGKKTGMDSFVYDRSYQDKEIAERNARYAEHQKKIITADDFIRNKGYDPAKVRIVQIMQPHWCEKNPPTHPEWIGKYKTETVEAV